MHRAFRTPFLRLSLFFVIIGALGIVQFAAYQPVQADSTYFQLCSGSTPNTFSQAWTDIGLIIANDSWSGVGSIEGYRGDNITASTGVDPQTLLGGDDGAPVLDVNANQTDPRAFTTGGATEFHLTDPTVALAGSGTADAPYLRLYLNSTGVTGLTVAYRVRDLEGPGATGTSDNAIQQAALHWRSGTSGNFTNVAAAYIADATTGPDLNASDTNVSVSLPAGALGQAQLQLRIMTTNAGGNDEWIGIDDIVITPTCAAPADEAPTATVDLAEGATNVPLISTFTYTFSEAVTIDWLSSAVSL
ncbi:MAG: hypothetical protein IAE80_18820, partial [Anaerolinea sp.]|nr:hypothetical protein [Anaerolinea sp.]